MPQISPNDDLATVIVIFKTTQDEQKKVLDQANANLHTVMEKKPGFPTTVGSWPRPRVTVASSCGMSTRAKNSSASRATKP